VRGVEGRGHRSGADAERLADRGVVEVGVVAKEHGRSLPLRQQCEGRTQLGVASLFTGDYRKKGVVSLGVDLATLGPPSVSTGSRPLTLILRHDPGTPLDPSDDLVVYRLGARNIPQANGRWRSFDFHVFSASATLPAGWQVLQGSGNDDTDYLWIPVVMQWNFWLHRKWSVFGEVGAAFRFDDMKEFGFSPLISWGGGRFHFTDSTALTLRLGIPFVLTPYISLGVSFLL